MYYSGLEDKSFNKKTDLKSKYIKALIIAFLLMLFYSYVMIYFNDYLTNNSFFVTFPTLKEHQKNQIVLKYKSLAVSICNALLIILMLASYLITDNIATSSITYLIMFLPHFIQEFCFNGIFIYYGLINERIEGTISMSKMVIQNCLCLFLIYIHWPCDIRERYDQIDEDPNILRGETIQDNGIFADAVGA